ncbi:hypothetical protein E4U17_004475 [Claviceps sp. LM77 group G4]|nr:hypothetical protein E4U17_004475 [Claviceps sp. LM77 group G4]KAG6066186.1 hypothetical protein E4U33_005668 [Claviceps sp. LM78 group G4]KAG6073207.1 hypothetical protein E4U16_004833 [Claviceps sp. LM84 group G4]
MKFLTSVVALATMASTTLACHCRTGSGGFDMDTTKVCYQPANELTFYSALLSVSNSTAVARERRGLRRGGRK